MRGTRKESPPKKLFLSYQIIMQPSDSPPKRAPIPTRHTHPDAVAGQFSPDDDAVVLGVDKHVAVHLIGQRVHVGRVLMTGLGIHRIQEVSRQGRAEQGMT